MNKEKEVAHINGRYKLIGIIITFIIAPIIIWSLNINSSNSIENTVKKTTNIDSMLKQNQVKDTTTTKGTTFQGSEGEENGDKQNQSKRKTCLSNSTVVDESGNPIGGAEVRFGQNIAITNSDGKFYFDPVHPGEYKLRVKIDGYTGYSEYINSQSKNVTIKLKDSQ